MFDFLKKPFAMPPKTSTRNHTVGNLTVPLRIVENARANRMTLRIEAGGRGLKITIPHGLKPSDVQKFLTRHQTWLEEKLAKYCDTPTLTAGMSIAIRGVPHIIHHDPSKRGSVQQSGSDNGAILTVYGDVTAIGKRVSDFLKKQAKRDIEPLALELALKCTKKIKTIRFKDTKSRWGSCSSSGNLSFSWRIMMAPPFVISYLVAHEVAHLTQMNHGSHFWALCQKLCDDLGCDMNNAKTWLKTHGMSLQMISF
jgi:predicted metal-dependent hydrolase